MKNFERYEKEIKEMIRTGNCISYLGQVAGKDFTYSSDVIKWLYEDYKEPLLTNEEKEYLKAVIKPFRNKINTISFDEDNIYFGDNYHRIGNIPNQFNNKKIFYNNRYLLEELGL